MNVQPTPVSASGITASIAGTGHAAARGGEQEKQTAEATRQQNTAEKPGGKSADSSAVDAGDATGDRGGDGRQTYDFFEKQNQPEDESSAPTNESPANPAATDSISNSSDPAKSDTDSPPHLDFRA